LAPILSRALGPEATNKEEKRGTEREQNQPTRRLRAPPWLFWLFVVCVCLHYCHSAILCIIRSSSLSWSLCTGMSCELNPLTAALVSVQILVSCGTGRGRRSAGTTASGSLRTSRTSTGTATFPRGDPSWVFGCISRGTWQITIHHTYMDAVFHPFIVTRRMGVHLSRDTWRNHHSPFMGGWVGGWVGACMRVTMIGCK
jgi:hypothetical protein